MLPSEFPEVQSSPNLKRLLAVQVDMQFGDLRTLLQLPKVESEGGCNLTAAAVLFNLIAGNSVCFYQASASVFTERRNRGARFVEMLRSFYPWDDEDVTGEEGAGFLYDSARNPLAHSLGLDPPAPGATGKQVKLRKWVLSSAQISELEESGHRPAWSGRTISEVERSGSTITKASISIPTLYWGVHRMLVALFRDSGQVQKAEALAAEFSYLWPQYSSGGAFITVFRRRRR